MHQCRRVVLFGALVGGAAACGKDSGGTPPGPTATQMAKVSGDSQVAAAGASLTAYAVIVKDASNNPVATVSVTWAVGAGGGSITSPTITDAGGMATAVRTLGTGAGTQTATASVGGLSGSPVTFTAFSQIQGATSMTANGGGAQSDTVLSTLATPVSVLVRDHVNNPVAGVIVNWSATGGGNVSQPVDTTDGSGISSVTRTLGATAGTAGTVATVTGLVGSPVTINATATAGAATTLALSGGNNQTGVVGTALATPHSVSVQDAHGNGKPGVTVTWVVGDGGGSVSSTSPVTNASGVASVTRTLGASPGSNTDTAKVNALSGSPVVFTATATTPPPITDISVQNNSFTPVTDTISVGGAVRWTWNCATCNPHNVSSTGGPASFSSGSPTSVSGTTYTFTFLTAGTYTYQCDIHGPAMHGTVVVQ
jgi:plastocyanin